MKTNNPAEPSPEVAPMQTSPFTEACRNCGGCWGTNVEGFCAGCRYVEGLDNLKDKHAHVPAVAPRETQTELRDVAVDIVDAIHGYTVEYAPSPLVHREKYDLAEKILRALRRRPLDG